jgi:hypothetical protein
MRKGEKIMGSYKVIMDNGSTTKDFESHNADNPTHAAFLAGVSYAAGVIFKAREIGVLDVLLDLTGPQAGIDSLIQTAEEETITVELRN